jgi:hypothetical protein
MSQLDLNFCEINPGTCEVNFGFQKSEYTGSHLM